MTTITYFDLASEYYMAYPLNGLLGQANAHDCRIRISKQTPSILKQIGFSAKDQQRLFSCGLFKVSTPGGSKWFCIDAHDDSTPEGYFMPLMDRVDHYFKLNLDHAVVETYPGLKAFRSMIHSLGMTFAIRPLQPWLFYPRLTPCAVYDWNWFSIKRRFRFLQRTPSIQWHRNLRYCQPGQDVFLVRRFYHEPGHTKSNQDCCRIFDGLKASGISGDIGFTSSSENIPQEYRMHLIGGDRPLIDHLQRMARSRICIFMPGTYDCLSFKLGQYLALGKPIVGMKLPFRPLPDMAREDNDLLESQFCCTNPGDVAREVIGLLHDVERLKFLSEENVRIFERYFSPQAVAERILSQVS